MLMFENASGELYFIYGLIALVVVLIIIVVIIDRMDNKKKRKSLSDTMSMKPISDPANFENSNPEVVELNSKKKEERFIDVAPVQVIEPVPEVKVEIEEKQEELVFEEEDEEVYVEPDLEKTQAQLRVEEITKALKEANIDEQIEKDKYQEFEEEQEKNAIISYQELKEEFDKLYEENEKRQYIDDNEIPININELYELNRKDEEQLEKHVEETKQQVQEPSSFKTSPYISPVYGIQNQKNESDTELKEANDFLNKLRELKDNLE